MLVYVTALLSPLIALLVAGEVEDFSMVDRILLGYHNTSYLINASIYLVKGGRLGLMPGVSTLAALVSVISVLCSRILHVASYYHVASMF